MPVEISRITIAASIQKVWNALTVPELVKRWQYDSELHTDWKPGSSIRFRTEWEGTVYEQWGSILEVNPCSLIRYTLFAPAPGREDLPENYFEMSYLLSEKEGKVILEIVRDDHKPGTRQEETQNGDNPVLSMLKSVCES
jgi:uncharacterized protein YndB with AHSA1/START domain